LKPRGNVHTVAEEVPSAYHYVTDVDTDAEIDALVSGEAGVRFSESSLRIHSALHRVNRTSELGKRTIARCICYPAPVVSNEPVEDRAPFGQLLERANLVSPHETAVARNVCREDCDEASAEFRRV
jgi:hypothetical protein